MHESSFPKRPTIRVRFEAGTRSGSVRAYYGVTRRGPDSGFPILKGFGAASAGRGFPTLKCIVESDQPGYQSVLGWIQWVTQDFAGGRANEALVDRFPSMLDRDIPFLAVGYAPTFFDAPAFNSLPKVDWRASAFLCTVPILSRREPIVPLVGFLWGYRIGAKGGTVTPSPISLARGRDWSAVRRELRKRHPAWRFATEFRAP